MAGPVASIAASVVVGRPTTSTKATAAAAQPRRPIKLTSRLSSAPDPPKAGGIRIRVTVYEEKVGWTAFADAAGVRFAEDFAAAPRHRANGFPRLEPGGDQRFQLPRQLVPAGRPPPQGRAAAGPRPRR